ncbi:nuclear envelope protein cut8 [Niveomyces insectorum RCEF 264]|uniref:Tethering factor for nuclear proteasome STS1 n=1 Tax=Niveomyces insectorum RCEF 264 TaxID=1081102 RepID=A0A168AG25_9HYPO|nr:nuclear envelope protein cut8 [Niveomyces insectorum RCEF 264]
MAASKKRKADDDAGEEMSLSPMSSPAVASRQLARPLKKVRAADMVGRPLPLPRLLEALDATQLRAILQTICDNRPDIAHQVAQSAPRPTAASTLHLLGEYQDRLRHAMPYGHSSADYNYYRVKQPLLALVDALAEYTRQFLPPVESQSSVSLEFLNGATKIIHQLPDWDSPTYRQHKEGAYDEVSRAWALVIQEASKRGGNGFANLLLSERWDQVLAKHNQQAGGRLEAAMSALSANLGWMGGAGGANGNSNNNSSNNNNNISDPNSIRHQLMNNTFGSPVRVGPW